MPSNPNPMPQPGSDPNDPNKQPPVPCATAAETETARAASKRMNAMYNAGDIKGIERIITKIRAAHGETVDKIIVDSVA